MYTSNYLFYWINNIIYQEVAILTKCREKSLPPNGGYQAKFDGKSARVAMYVCQAMCINGASLVRS